VIGLTSDEYPVASATEEFRYHPLFFGEWPLLHDWEAHAVKGMKLTKYWKPTPFPCEL
jgi:hypothetical protein